MRFKSRLLPLYFLLMTLVVAAQNQKSDSVAAPEISTRLSATTFLTKDVTATVQFYVDMLGFKENRRFEINDKNSLAVFGLTDVEKVDYISLLPTGWGKGGEIAPGINLVAVPNAQSSMYDQDVQRTPFASELIMAFSVTGLRKIETMMRDAGIRVIVPLTPSATGKSLTLTVLDPNGVRIQLYEYVK